MSKSNTNAIENKIKKMYSGLGWVSIFTRIRFWTGSFTQLEKFVPKEGKILDLGCGYGILANYLALCSPKRSIVGIDTDLGKIKYANRGLRNVSFKRDNATKMKLGNLDCIILHDVLHHLDSFEEQKKLIEDCKEMLNRNGMLLIVEVDKNPFWKLVLGRITDFVMYKGHSVLYLYTKSMIPFINKHFSSDVRIERFYNNPYPQVVYICKK